MLLSELPTPFEKHRIIEYKANGNTPVRHWYNAQHITGPLYKSEDIVGDSGLNGLKTFHIFLIYNQGKSGIILCRHTMHPEKYSIEQCEDMIKANHLETPESYIKQLHQRIAAGKFIGNADIEFVKQFDKASADMFTQHRASYYAQREAEEKEAAAAQLAVKQAEDNMKQLQKIQERQKQHEILLGWEEQLSNLQIYRAIKHLTSMIRVDGIVMQHHEFIKKYIKDGWLPHKKENETHFYGSRFNPKESKPKTNYYLHKDNIAYTITKTEYDFALYIIKLQSE